LNRSIPVLCSSATAIAFAMVLPQTFLVLEFLPLLIGKTGGGARIRTEKFGFGDRQFNR
jgi:hypothetical protein